MPIPILSAIPVVGKIVESVLGIVDKSVKDKDQAAQLKHDIGLAIMQMDHSEFETLIKEQSSIIQSEATGSSWLQRNWRPGLMLIIMVIIANNYILFPYASMFTDKAVVLELPVHMWDLIKLGVGGYVIGRSGEKMVKEWKS